MNNQKVFHFLFLFALTIGLLFDTQAHQMAFGAESGQFLSETKISSPPTIFSDLNSFDSATVENEEKEEKEEKENESEREGFDLFLTESGKGTSVLSFGSDFFDYSTVFSSYPKGKLYLLFHCLRSHLA